MTVSQLRKQIAGLSLNDEMRSMPIKPETEILMARMLSMPADQQRAFLCFARRLYAHGDLED